MGETERASPIPDLLRLLARVFPKTVIDRRDLDSRLASARPARSEQHERDGIWTTGNGQEQPSCFGERRENRAAVQKAGPISFLPSSLFNERAALAVTPLEAHSCGALLRVGAHQHWFFLTSFSAAARILAGAFGYFRPTSPKAAQACSLAPPIAFKDWPSRSIASGARFEAG